MAGPNAALRAARGRRGWKKSQLIHALRRAASARGEQLPADASLNRRIALWENQGTPPDERYQALLCEVYNTTPATLGFVTADDSSPVTYPDTIETAVEQLARLCGLDAIDDTRLTNAQPLDEGWTSPAIRWLLARPDDLPQREKTGIHVGAADVAAIRATATAFMSLDFQYGGGHARTALAHYYHHDVRPMLDGTYSPGVGRTLLKATAELVEVLGWTAYDTQRHGAARRYLVHALRLTQAADDRMLGGVLLANLSHQANYLGDFREAAQLARAAQEGAKSRATPTALALFAAHEARAHASAGEERAATAAIADAERYFSRSNSADDPEWLRYFDSAELAGEIAHCFRDLGVHHPHLINHAREHVDRAVAETGPQYSRTLGFVRMVQASIDLESGEVDKSLTHAKLALASATGLKSARFQRYVTDYRRQLTRYADVPAVRDFLASFPKQGRMSLLESAP